MRLIDRLLYRLGWREPARVERLWLRCVLDRSAKAAAGDCRRCGSLLVFLFDPRRQLGRDRRLSDDQRQDLADLACRVKPMRPIRYPRADARPHAGNAYMHIDDWSG